MNTPLQRAISGAPIGEASGADFRKNTWTFTVPARQPVCAGRYVLLPAVIAELAIAQEQAETAGDIRLVRRHICRTTFRPIGNQPALQIDFEGGSSTLLYRDMQPPEYRGNWHPAYWHGSETRVDQNGEEWRGQRKHYVQDDFGLLVEVPA